MPSQGAVPFNGDAIPAEMKPRPQWLVWKEEIRDGKPTKVPYNPRTTGKAKADNPATWGTFEQAVARYEKDGTYKGIGYVFHADDPYTGIDLDKCLNADGTLKDWAVPFVASFNSYTEITPSGTGLHILIEARMTEGSRHKVIYEDGAVEAYDRGRFFTMTGQRWTETPSFPAGRQSQFNAFYAEVFPAKETAPAAAHTPSTPVDLDDRELLERMFAAKNGATIERLWKGDTSDHGEDDSAADLALCDHLAFWTDRDAARMDTLFRQSGLYREKWDRQDYRDWTIGKAIAATPEGYSSPGVRLTMGGVDYEQERQEKFAEKADRANRGKRKTPDSLGDFAGLIEIVEADDLLLEEIPEQRWAVPKLLPEGLCLLAGRPKLGKSWLALAISIAIAQGGKALGTLSVERGIVLYMGLEDSKRRMKTRLKIILGREPCPRGLSIVRKWPTMGEHGHVALDLMLTEYPDIRLVVIDTLQRFRGAFGRRNNGNIYEEDYEAMSALQTMALKHRVCILLVHHTRKAVSDDPLEMVSGTHGITGVLDGLLVLMRNRCELDATLFVTGRDIEEDNLALKFDRARGLWYHVGNAEDYAKSKERQEILSFVRSKASPVSPKDIAEHLSKPRSTVRRLLAQMALDGEIFHYGDTSDYYWRGSGGNVN